MKNRINIDNFLIIQQENSIRINGIGKNEVLIFSESLLECEVCIKNKKVGSYIVKEMVFFEQKSLDSAVLEGTLYGIKSETGRTLSYVITVTTKEHMLDITVAVDAKVLNTGEKRIKLAFQKSEDEKFFGFGEQNTNLDLTYKTIPLCRQGSFSTSICVTSKDRGFIIDPQNIVDVDTGKNNDNINFCVWNTSFKLQVSFATSIAKVVEMQNKKLCCPKILPSWAFGTIIGVHGGKVAVEQQLENCLKENIKIDAIWIQDWQGWRGCDDEKTLLWHLYPDEKTYPEFKSWVRELNEKNVKVLGYINPFVSVDPDCPIYLEAHAKGYFLIHSDGTDYICTNFGGVNDTYCQVDLSNMVAYEWLKNILRKGLVENGFSGWFTDYAGYTPFDAVCNSGNIIQYHCELPALWAKLNEEIIENTDREFFLGQRSFALDAKISKLSEYNKIAHLITGILNAGMSGILMNNTTSNRFCTDSSCSKKMRTVDELYRWCEFAAFTQVYMVCDIDTLLCKKFELTPVMKYKILAQFAHLHASLLEYIKIVEKETILLGLPVLRALFMQFPNDKQSWAVKYQYLLGDSLMIAPVLKKNTKNWKVWLPAGSWQHLWSKSVYFSTGQYINVFAPVGRPPIFIYLNGENANILQKLF